MENVEKVACEEDKETYDELDENEMVGNATGKSSDNNRGPAAEPCHSGIAFEYPDTNGLPRKFLSDTYLSAKSTEVINCVENNGINIENIYLHMTDDENLKNADKDKNRGDSYLTPMDVKNLNNGTVPSDENSIWENNPSSEARCSKGVKDGVMG